MKKLWLARDKAGWLVLYGSKPSLNAQKTGFDCMEIWGLIPLKKEMFPEITFENSPIEMELTIKSKMRKTCDNCRYAYFDSHIVGGKNIKGKDCNIYKIEDKATGCGFGIDGSRGLVNNKACKNWKLKYKAKNK